MSENPWALVLPSRSDVTLVTADCERARSLVK